MSGAAQGLGSFFGTIFGGNPAVPKPPKPAPMPVPDDQALLAQKRRDAAMAAAQGGRASTMLTGDNGLSGAKLGG